MPVCLFTFHAYGSWMPDRTEGYVQRGRGVLPTDPEMARAYRSRQNNLDVVFDFGTRETIIEIVQTAAAAKSLQIHGIATDPTHVHALLAWRDDRTAVRGRQKLKESLTRGLNQRFGQQAWFSRGGHDRRVRDREHLTHLLNQYLPSHIGPNWSCNHSR
jgi:REP element-mobilizing transposase RayT